MKKVTHWLSQKIGQNLLLHSSIGAYFEPLIQKVKPSWRVGFYRAQVLSCQQLNSSVVSVWLKVDKDWPLHEAGQHLELTREVNGKLITRVFTIASSPQKAKAEQLLRLAIKQKTGGQFTPSLSTLKSGDWLNISAPKGQFTIDLVTSDLVSSGLVTSDKSALFLAAGSGITPFISMLSSMSEKPANKSNGVPENQQKTHLIYYAREGEHLLVDELKNFANTIENFSFELMTRSANGGVGDQLPMYNESTFFVCGPAAFYQDVEQYAKAHNVKLYSEHFSALPIETLETRDEASFNLSYRGKQIEVTNTKPLLTQLLERGEQVMYGCQMGICHQCHCTKTKGVVKNILTGDLSDTGEELIQLCTSQIITDVELKA